MGRNKLTTTTVVVSTGVLLTIGAMFVAAPSVYAESTCIGVCKNHHNDVDSSQDNDVDNSVDGNVDNSVDNSVDNNIDNEACTAAGGGTGGVGGPGTPGGGTGGTGGTGGAGGTCNF